MKEILGDPPVRWKILTYFHIMNSTENRLRVIEQKVALLIEKLQSTQSENDDLKSQIHDLISENQSLRSELKSVEEHRKHLLFSHSIQGEDDLDFARKQVSEMIREVDRCMSLIQD